MKRSESIAHLTAALAQVQGSLSSVAKDHTAKVQMKSGGQYSYNYATLASALDICRGPLAAAGLAIIQSPLTEGRKVTLTTLVSHVSNEWVENELTMEASESTPQALGSVITYLRRYSLCPLIGLAADEDDDGQAASKPTPGAPRRQEQPKPPPPQATKPAPAAQKPKGSAGDRLLDAAGVADPARVEVYKGPAPAPLPPGLTESQVLERDPDPAPVDIGKEIGLGIPVTTIAPAPLDQALAWISEAPHTGSLESLKKALRELTMPEKDREVYRVAYGKRFAELNAQHKA